MIISLLHARIKYSAWESRFSIVETKRSSTTHLSKGQKAAREHVDNGNGIFEVRSNRPGQGLSKGGKIRVKDYHRVNKIE